MTQLTRRSVLRWGLSLPAVAAGARLAAAADSSNVAGPTVEIPFDMPGYVEPAFPDRTFPITDFGAAPGGEAMNTKALAEAIAACAAAGGGRVLVPAGVWLTGPIHLKSNVNLHVAEGAELRFSDKFEDYLPVVYMQRGGTRCYNYSPLIYARDCTNIAVTGKGTLNGQGQAWWPWKKRQPGMTRLFQMGADQVPVEQRVFGTEADGVRTCFIQPIDCKNVLLEGFTVVNGPSWNVHPVTCENLTVRGVSVTTLGPNNDGIDPDSCRNVIVEDCFLDTGDDCICLKAGRNEDGWAVGKPCENVVVRRCRTQRGHGGIVMGSEMSAGIRNVFVHDCQFDGTQRGIRIKSRPGRGGVIENVWFQNITMSRIRGEAIHITLRYGSQDSATQSMPTFRNIHIRRATCDDAKRAVEILGLADGFIQNVTLEDVTISAQTGLRAEYVRGLRLAGVSLAPKTGSVFHLGNAQDVLLARCKYPADVETLLRVEGDKASQIVLQQTEVANPQQAITFGADAPQQAVRIVPPAETVPR